MLVTRLLGHSRGTQSIGWGAGYLSTCSLSHHLRMCQGLGTQAKHISGQKQTALGQGRQGACEARVGSGGGRTPLATAPDVMSSALSLRACPCPEMIENLPPHSCPRGRAQMH